MNSPRCQESWDQPADVFQPVCDSDCFGSKFSLTQTVVLMLGLCRHIDTARALLKLKTVNHQLLNLIPEQRGVLWPLTSDLFSTVTPRLDSLRRQQIWYQKETFHFQFQFLYFCLKWIFMSSFWDGVHWLTLWRWSSSEEKPESAESAW